MSKSMSGFVKGIGAGMLAGAAVVTAGKMVLDSKKTRHCITKGTSKAFRAVGDFVEGVQTLMK